MWLKPPALPSVGAIFCSVIKNNLFKQVNDVNNFVKDKIIYLYCLIFVSNHSCFQTLRKRSWVTGRTRVGGSCCTFLSCLADPLPRGLPQRRCRRWLPAWSVRPPPPTCAFFFPLQARALTPQTAETDAIRFLVGTQSLKYDNQVTISDKCIHVNYQACS